MIEISSRGLWHADLGLVIFDNQIKYHGNNNEEKFSVGFSYLYTYHVIFVVYA